MSLKLEKMIAMRYLRSRRREGFISIIAAFSLIGIALGVAALIIVMAVMNGFRAEITSKIIGLNGHIILSGYTRNLEKFDALSKSLQSFEGVTAVTPFIDGQVMAVNGDYSSGAMVKGIRVEDIITNKPLIAGNIVAGDIKNLTNEDNIAIGARLAAALGLRAGDELTLISPQGKATAIGTMPRLKTYIIGAIFQAGMYEYDSGVIFMPLSSAQIFFKYPNSVSSIEIITTDPDKSDVIAAQIYKATEGLYSVRNWQTVNAELFNALKVERTVMFFILTLIVFIAAFNIISSLIMLVNDKGKDIAILRTMGATKSSIMRIFFICGSSIGIIGTLAGLVIGVSFSLNIERIKQFIESITGNQLFDPVIYFLSELPAKLQLEDVVMSVTMGIIFSFAATIYPAWKASKQNPAEALRYE